MIEVVSCGPLITIQDIGRPGHLALGLARGGAADIRALAEARALLGDAGAGLEIPGSPLVLRFHMRMTVALTGMPMGASCDGRVLEWHASHEVEAGQVVTLRPTIQGGYSYLHAAGGLQTPEVMGSRAAHLIAGIGRALETGDRLDTGGTTALQKRLTAVPDRFGGGVLRCVATPQTALFSGAEIARFEASSFTRDPRGNRQGMRLGMDGPGFATDGQLGLLSDFILPGDVQMTGDGVPYILGPECQTTGGYPRIAHVIAADLPRAVQAPVGASLTFAFIGLDAARAATPPPPAVTPLVRDPAQMADLLGYQLIGGVVDAREGEQ